MTANEQWRERQKELIEELTAGLREQLKEYTSNGEWAEFMRATGSMPKRSIRNQMLIVSQHERAFKQGRVDTPYPKLVFGFYEWKQRDRSVMRGQRGYRVIQPLMGRYKTLPDGQLARVGKDYQPQPGEKIVSRPYGFKAGTVFDIAQTDGAEIRGVDQPEQIQLQGNAPEWFMDVLTQELKERGFSIELGVDPETDPHLAGATEGYTNFSTKRVVVKQAPSAMMGAVLAHELGHVLMEHDHASDVRGIKEVEAEGSAALMLGVAGYVELPEQYALPYIAGWASTVNEKSPDEVYAQVIDRISDRSGPIVAKLYAAKEEHSQSSPPQEQALAQARQSLETAAINSETEQQASPETTTPEPQDPSPDEPTSLVAVDQHKLERLKELQQSLLDSTNLDDTGKTHLINETLIALSALNTRDNASPEQTCHVQVASLQQASKVAAAIQQTHYERWPNFTIPLAKVLPQEVTKPTPVAQSSHSKGLRLPGCETLPPIGLPPKATAPALGTPFDQIQTQAELSATPVER